jgi:hypothetical protein
MNNNFNEDGSQWGSDPLEEFIIKTVGLADKDGAAANRLRAAFHREIAQMKTEVETAESAQLRESYLRELIAARGNIHAIVEIKNKYAALGMNVY